VMLIVVFSLDGSSAANCIRCELATVGELAVPVERKLRRSRACRAGGTLPGNLAMQISDMLITSS